jgi:hypothetical protein
MFAGPVLIGSANYFIFQRLTRREFICAEAERWLAERRRTDTYQVKRRGALRRFALWTPTLTVALVCLFFDGTWAVTSHLLHPGRGKLIGYEVPIPLSWTILYIDLGANRGGAHDIVVAARYRDLLLAGSIGERPPFSVSIMNFRSTPGGDPLASRPGIEVISTRTLPLGKRAVTCLEERPPEWMMAKRYIRCSTSEGDFSGDFNGNDEDAAQFYRTLEAIKPRA